METTSTSIGVIDTRVKTGVARVPLVKTVIWTGSDGSVGLMHIISVGPDEAVPVPVSFLKVPAKVMLVAFV